MKLPYVPTRNPLSGLRYKFIDAVWKLLSDAHHEAYKNTGRIPNRLVVPAWLYDAYKLLLGNTRQEDQHDRIDVCGAALVRGAPDLDVIEAKFLSGASLLLRVDTSAFGVETAVDATAEAPAPQAEEAVSTRKE